MDRISQLPQHIIHDILCFLPTKDAARTSILSKTWLCAWSSFPNFDFDEDYFGANDVECYYYREEKNKVIRRNKDNFLNFVDNTLQRCLEQDLSIKKFRLRVLLLRLGDNVATHIDRWLWFAIERNVKELDLKIDYYNYYSLPQAVLHAKTINVLKLYGCLLESYSNTKLSHLQELSLVKVNVDEEILENFISRCLLIKDLRLKYCHTLKYLKVLSLPQLNRVQVESCDFLKKIEIEAPSLQTFHYNGCSYSRPCEITLKACGILREVTLRTINMKDQQLQHFISKFPSIEVLVLNDWKNLGGIKISSQTLKRLVLRSVNVVVADIDAPNLISLEYVYNTMPFYSIHSPNLQEIEIIFRGRYGLWHRGLKEFLQNCNNSKGLTLAFRLGENVIVHEDSSGITLLPVKFFMYYDASIKITSRSYSHLLEELGWSDWIMKSLSIVSPSNSKLLKILYEKPEYLFRSYCMHVSLEKIASFNGDPATSTDRVTKALIKLHEKMQYKTTTFRVGKVI